MPSGLAPDIQNSSLTGAAGQYYLFCRLCLSGKIAALALAGVRNADIVVTTVDGARLWRFR